MRVGVVFGGRSVEHLVSIRSARTVCEGVAAAGHDVVLLVARLRAEGEAEAEAQRGLLGAAAEDEGPALAQQGEVPAHRIRFAARNKPGR